MLLDAAYLVVLAGYPTAVQALYVALCRAARVYRLIFAHLPIAPPDGESVYCMSNVPPQTISPNGPPHDVINVLRQHAETQFVRNWPSYAWARISKRPPQWQLSPCVVITYLIGGKLDNGFVISVPIHRRTTGSWKLRFPRWSQIVRCCSMACRGQPNPGFPSIWPPPSPVIPPDRFRAQPARVKRPCAMAGTMPASWPKGRQRMRWCLVRSCVPCVKDGLPGSKS